MKWTRRSRSAKQSKCLMQQLEPRLLMSYSSVNANIVVMHTTLGEIAVQLYNDMPITTANFLSYVNSGAYNGTIFHRTTTQSQQGTGIAVVQGGGYTVNSTGTELVPITTNAPITNEWTASHPNDAGTIAMARTTDVNSATSQFYFNVTNNPGLDDPADQNQYADFGNVIRGMNVITTIDSLQTTTTPVPITGGGQVNPPVTASGFVTVTSATEEQLYTLNIGHNDAAGDQSVTYRDAAGAKTTISIPGGSATLMMTGDGVKITRHGRNLRVSGNHLEVQSISCNSGPFNTLNINSRVTTKKTKQGVQTNFTAIGDIKVNGALKALNAKGAALNGSLSATGAIGVLNLYDASGSGTIVVGPPTGRIKDLKVKIKFMDSIDVVSQTPITTFTTRQFTNGDSVGHYVEAPSIDRIAVPGQLAASIYVISPDQSQTPGRLGHIQAGFLQSATIQAGNITSARFGEMKGSAFYSINPYKGSALGIGNLRVGTVDTTSILSVGNIGRVRINSMTGSNIIAGAETKLPPGSFPTEFGAAATIERLAIFKGGHHLPSFSNSQISAPHIRNIRLGWIDTTPPAGGTSGVKAADFGTLTGLLLNGKKKRTFTFNQLSDQGVFNRTVARENLPIGSLSVEVGPVTISSPPSST